MTEAPEGIDDTVLAIGRSYNVKGQLEKFTSYGEIDSSMDSIARAIDGGAAT